MSPDSDSTSLVESAGPRDELVTILAASLAVLIVAAIAVLMGMA